MKHIFLSTIAALGISAASAQAATISLDFEDQQLPSASGWQSFGGGTSTVIAGTVPGKTGNYVLNITGRDLFGWFFDLTGIIEPNSSWQFDADIQRVQSINLGGGGINDIAITKFGGSNQQALNIAGITDTNWHAFSMAYDAVSGTFSGTIDGNPGSIGSSVTSFSPEGIMFVFGNQNVVKTVNFDNIDFTFTPTTVSEVPLPASAFLLLGGLGLLAARRKTSA